MKLGTLLLLFLAWLSSPSAFGQVCIDYANPAKRNDSCEKFERICGNSIRKFSGQQSCHWNRACSHFRSDLGAFLEQKSNSERNRSVSEAAACQRLEAVFRSLDSTE